MGFFNRLFYLAYFFLRVGADVFQIESSFDTDGSSFHLNNNPNNNEKNCNFQVEDEPSDTENNSGFLLFEPDILRQRPDMFSGGTKITVSLFVTHIQRVDQKNGYASMSFYIKHKWIDKRLAWHFTSNDTVDCYFVPSYNIWTPSDMGFGYNVISSTNPALDSEFAHVCYDGSVTTWKVQTFLFAAVFNNEQFPFDEQTVTTSYGHPFAGIQEIDVDTDIASAAQYDTFWPHVTPNVEWNLNDIGCSRTVYSYPKSRAYREYPLIICTISISRNAGQYVIFFCIPSIVVSFVGLLGMFYGAKDSKEAKVQLALMSLMTLSVLSLSLSEDMPSSHRVSRMHKFYICQMLVSSFGAIISCILRRFEDGSVGTLKKKVVTWCRLAFCLVLNLVLLTSSLVFFLS